MIAAPTTFEDFLVGKWETHQSLSLLLDPDVTFYCINKDLAMFVRCPDVPNIYK